MATDAGAVSADVGAATEEVPQSQPLSDDQVPNNAGGFVYKISDFDTLRRFIILGSDGNNYYVSRESVDAAGAECVLRLLASGQGTKVVEEVTRISQEGRAPRQSPGIFVLAMCARLGDATTRHAALAALPAVCRTASTLFELIQRCKELGPAAAGARPSPADVADPCAFKAWLAGGKPAGKPSWGRSMRRAVALWYLSKSPAAVAYQVTKYSQRNGWSHADLLRLAHPDPEEHAAKRRKVAAAAADAKAEAPAATGDGGTAAEGEAAAVAEEKAAVVEPAAGAAADKEGDWVMVSPDEGGGAEGEEQAQEGAAAGAASEQGALAAAAAAEAAAKAAAEGGDVAAVALALEVADMKAIFDFVTHGTVPGQQRVKRKAKRAAVGEVAGEAAPTAAKETDGAEAAGCSAAEAGPAADDTDASGMSPEPVSDAMDVAEQTPAEPAVDGPAPASATATADVPATAMDVAEQTPADPAVHGPAPASTTATADVPATAMDVAEQTPADPAVDGPAPASTTVDIPAADTTAAPTSISADVPTTATDPAATATDPAVAASTSAIDAAAAAIAALSTATPAASDPAAAADAAPASTPGPSTPLSPVMQYLIDAHRLRKEIRLPPPLVKERKDEAKAKGRGPGRKRRGGSAAASEPEAPAAEPPQPPAEPDAAAVAAHAAATTAVVEEVVSLVRRHRFGHEHVGDTGLLRTPALWAAFLEVGMPLTALIRNLGRMTQLGVTDAPEHVARITARLTNPRALAAARVHPMTVLEALCTYSNGAGARGKARWAPCGPVKAALEAAFYLAFKNVEPTGKRYLAGLDVSGSMGSACAGMTSVSCCDAAAAMLMSVVRTEPWLKTLAFSHELVPMELKPEDKLEEVVNRGRAINMGGTDCALPILYATEKRLAVDVFLIFTDNETWFGTVHPAEALKAYRKAMNLPDTKLVVFGFSATSFSIADPNDPGMLDVAGLDSAVPRLLADFVLGRL